MSKSAFSLFVFATYEFFLGAQLIAAPNQMFHFFGMPETHEVWIRVVGVLALCFGYINFMAARSELAPLFRWSVPVRFAVPVFFIAFVVLGFAPPTLILFGAIDAAGATWTALSLRKDGLSTSKP